MARPTRCLAGSEADSGLEPFSKIILGSWDQEPALVGCAMFVAVEPYDQHYEMAKSLIMKHPHAIHYNKYIIARTYA